MSESDLEAGVRWNDRIQHELSDTKFGIVCVTAGNMESPWLLFESGALAKTIDDSYVCPYLIGLEKSELTGPLSQFQAKLANLEDTLSIVLTLNRALGAEALEQDRVERAFERWWPDLEAALSVLPNSEELSAHRTTEDMLEEILLLMRSVEQRTRDRVDLTASTFETNLFEPPSPHPAFLHYWSSRASRATTSDRRELKAVYNYLRDKLAELPPEESDQRQDKERK